MSFETDTETLFETKYFRDRYQDFFSRPNVFETDTEIFFETNVFETDTETRTELFSILNFLRPPTPKKILKLKKKVFMNRSTGHPGPVQGSKMTNTAWSSIKNLYFMKVEERN